MNSNGSNKLYRYQPFQSRDADKMKRLEDLFAKNQCYMVSPLWFNDPFDCKTLFTMRGSTPYHLEKFIKKLTGRSPSPKGVNVDALKQGVRRVVEKAGMLCLTEHRDNILMWSHYADGHRGFCIQLDMPLIKKNLVQVTYRHDYPTFKEFVHLEPNDIVKFLLARKSDEWAYEGEWRVILHAERGLEEVKSRPVSLPPNSLTGVIFGCNMLESDRDQIRKWVSQRETATAFEFHEAVRKEDEYGVEIRRLNG